MLRWLLASIVLVVELLLPTALLAQQPPLHAKQLQALHFRHIGPAVTGGRIHDVEAVPDNPSTLFVASASGGIWRSTNNGTTWTPIFENEAVSTFGDLAISLSDPQIIWAGTGEQQNRQSTSWGNGVYRTTDGGDTWQHLGLEETRHISKVVVHPADPDVAYVGALGNLWRPSEERGVYKSRDGGATWDKVLYVDSLTGIIDLVMDPRKPDVLYAATYQRLRRAWGFNGGGPGSGMYKTVDGGKTWQELTGGIPSGDKGRIGLAIAPSNPDVLYATIEHANDGGTYRTRNGGQDWERVNRLNQRPMYYSHVYVDPTDERRVFELATSFYMSDDGGDDFRRMPTNPTYDVGVHSDFHALWIDPSNSAHFFLAGDGGLHESWDRGETYRKIDNLPIAQFYAIGVDHREPYNVYGGLQDNHSWAGPSANRRWIGIVNDDWKQIGFGDGMYHQPDPTDRFVYNASQNGNIVRFDVETGDMLNIKPAPAAGEPSYRFDWTAPMLLSQHDRSVIYLGGNRLFISRDRGDSWTRTKDLTKQIDRDTLLLMGVAGKDITLSKNDGASSFGELTTIAESPLDANVLWAGADDGNLQVSRDGGQTWSEVSANVPNLPSGTYVSRVVGSGTGAGAAYASFDAHRDGNFAPYVYRTDDFGQSWRPVMGNLPEMGSVNVIREHPRNPRLLFAGTEHGVFATVDAGTHWAELTGHFPTVLVDDLLIHPVRNDLVVGTHGRSILILDDIAPLVEWSAQLAAAPAHLFSVRPTSIQQFWKDTSYRSQAAYAGRNPPDGAILTYMVRGPSDSGTIAIANAAGQTVRTLPVHADGGGALNRVTWDLRHELPAGSSTNPPADTLAHPVTPRGPYVSTGTYTATLAIAGHTTSQTIVVQGDSRLPLTAQDYRTREMFLLDLLAAQRRLRDLEAGLRTDLDDATRSTDSTRALTQELGRLRRGVQALMGQLNGNGVRQGSLHPPTQTQRDRWEEIQRAIREIDESIQQMQQN